MDEATEIIEACDLDATVDDDLLDLLDFWARDSVGKWHYIPLS